MALLEIVKGAERRDEGIQCRGWKLFLLLPRMLLFRPPRGGNIPKQRLVERFASFSRGEWEQLLIQSAGCDEAAAQRFQRRRRTHVDTPERRADRAQSSIMMGEVSSGRHALEGAPLAPGTQRTLEQLRDPVRRPTTPYTPLPEALLSHQPELAFELDKDLFVKNLKCARRGAAAGPSGMMTEHLRPILENVSDVGLLFQVAQFFATASIPEEILEALRVGRLTTLQKPNGGVRGIVAGDVFRRVVARTMAQQLGPEIERATSPFQYALSTRAGTECIAHAIQASTDLNPNATVLSIDGMGAFDMVSRQAMLQAFTTVVGGDAALPFVRQFYGSASTYLWEDQDGIVHTIMQAEGGEQGDPLVRVPRRCLRRVFAGWGQCDFGVFAERLVPPLFHPCAPREKPRCGTRKVWCHMASM